MSDLARKALEELNQLKFDGDEDSGTAEDMGNRDLMRDFRNSDFFTSRPYEHDDDFPNFTGKSDVVRKATAFFSSEVLGAYTLEADDQEKGWFTLYLRKNK